MVVQGLFQCFMHGPKNVFNLQAKSGGFPGFDAAEGLGLCEYCAGHFVRPLLGHVIFHDTADVFVRIGFHQGNLFTLLMEVKVFFLLISTQF